MSSAVSQQVYQLVSQIPVGSVSTYGDIASHLGLKTPRQVGWILHQNPSMENAPCHRVVFADGSLSGNYAFGGPDAQKNWLLSEGVSFKGEKVVLKIARWDLAQARYTSAS